MVPLSKVLSKPLRGSFSLGDQVIAKELCLRLVYSFCTKVYPQRERERLFPSPLEIGPFQAHLGLFYLMIVKELHSRLVYSSCTEVHPFLLIISYRERKEGGREGGRERVQLMVAAGSSIDIKLKYDSNHHNSEGTIECTNQ